MRAIVLAMQRRTPVLMVCVGLLACSSRSVTRDANQDAGSGGGSAGSGGLAGAGGAAGSGGSGGGNALAALSDEFDDIGLDAKWQVFNPNLVAIDVPAGAANLIPADSIWFNQQTGPLVYQNVTGDFRVSTHVRVTNVAMTADPPLPIHWGGLMVRDPNSGQPNTVHIVIGRDSQGSAGITLERSSTTDGSTDYDNQPWTGAPQNVAELRICRVGEDFRLYTRPEGATTWAPQFVYVRTMPSTLQVGMVAHASSANPDLLAQYDWVRYASVSSLADCTAD